MLKQIFMKLWESIFLGVVQGLTEFLPVSSSGHLAIIQKTMNIEGATIFFDILLHVATLGSILIYFRQEVLVLLRSVPRVPNFIRKLFQKGHLAIADDEQVWMLLLLCLSTAVTVAIALPLESWIETHFHNLILIGICYLLTGSFLLSTLFTAPEEIRKKRRKNIKGMAQVSLKDAVLLGLAQSAALLPGISRSGSTISAALHLRMSRQKAGEYSFLLAIPIILGALIVKLAKGVEIQELHISIIGGFISAFITGLIALHFLIPWIKKGKLHYFSWYCFGVSALCLYLSFFK
ncbi:MAG: undecaprenyl-diphosphate phosphatase [Bdellovibrionales bacterium]|nr:undecaprenyl-diphosphate phosphatase [Bdellovibrionales bacterium]